MSLFQSAPPDIITLTKITTFIEELSQCFCHDLTTEAALESLTDVLLSKPLLVFQYFNITISSCFRPPSTLNPMLSHHLDHSLPVVRSCRILRIQQELIGYSSRLITSVNIIHVYSWHGYTGYLLPDSNRYSSIHILSFDSRRSTIQIYEPTLFDYHMHRSNPAL